MQNYTQDYLNKIRSQTREMKGYVTFNGDSTKVLAGNNGLVSLKVHQSAMEDERYCIGSVCSSYCEMTFFNSGLPSGVSLANSYFDAYIGIVMGVVNQVNLEQYTCMGRFYITEISRGKETTQVVGYDVTSRLNKDYAPTVTQTAQGYLVMDILNDIIDQCGVNNGTHFTDVGNNVYVQQIYEGTCKEQWGWLMSLCNSDGKCYFGSRTDLGMIEGHGYTDGASVYDSYPALDDAVIYLDGYSDGDDFTVNSLTTGTDDSPIVIGNGVGINAPNPYMTETQATAIYNTLHGVTFTPMNLHFRGDMMIDLFDSLKVTQGGTDHRCVVMSIETTFNGGLEQTIECWGDSEEYYAMSSGRMNTIESKVSTNSTMLQEIAQSIETARGGVITQVLDTDGTWKELVIANSQDLSQATSVWRFNIEGLAHSTRYTGGVYSFALDDDGNIVANRIQVGTLQDAAGKNSWDMETGAFTITKGSINVETNSSSYDVIAMNNSAEIEGATHDFTNKMSPVGNTLKEEIQNGATLTAQYQASSIRLTNSASVDTSPAFSVSSQSGRVTTSGSFNIERNGATMISIGGANNKLYFYDSDGYMRVTLDLTDGLRFFNTNGTVAAEYPSHFKSRESFGTIKPYSSRGTVDSGGFYRIGSQCNVNFLFTSSYSATNTPRITGMSAVPQMTSPLQAIDLSTHEPVGCYVNTAGNIYLKTTVSGHQYAIGGTFII